MEPLVLIALRGHAPFDEMEEEALRFLAQKATLAYTPRGEEVTGPGGGVAQRLHIVKQGRVRGEADYGPGDFFPVGALIGRRATTNRYVAAEDTFCWQLEAADFHALLERSPRFRAYCTDYLAALVGRAHRVLRETAAASTLDDAGMLMPLRSRLARAPVACEPGMALGKVLATMRDARVGSMVVVDAARIPVGIFTTVDALSVAAAGAPLEAPIGEFMTRSPVTLEEDATLADAALAMARHGIRHVVVTRDGRLAGVVSERDLFALQSTGIARIAERVRGAGSLEDLAAAAGEVRGLAARLLAQGVGAEALTAMVSALNDSLSSRAIEIVSQTHALRGAWCWLALGSEGRREQTLVTDQDNALIVQGDPKAFLGFADAVNRALEACGFPLCKGDIMARNPRWCLTPEQWRAVFSGWIGAPQPQALLNAAIFFDFRPLAGTGHLAGELRDAVLPQARANRAFCRALAQVALEARPPLGLLRDFAADEIDLKGLGARVFVDCARVLALAAGSPETGTAARLRGAGEAAAVEAFHFIQALRLRAGGNRIRAGGLSELERRVLKESFRQASLLQARCRLDFAL